MVELWYALLCVTLTVFIVLDGWDIGAGVLHWIVAKTAPKRADQPAAPTWTLSAKYRTRTPAMMTARPTNCPR